MIVRIAPPTPLSLVNKLITNPAEASQHTMHILLLTNEISRNNGWATVSYYLKEEIEKKHRVSVLTQDTIQCRSYYNYFELKKRAAKIVKTTDPVDVIVCNVEPYMPLAAMLKQNFGAKLLFVGHGTYAYFPFLKGWKGKFNRFFSKYVDRVVVPSVYTQHKVRSWWPHEIDLVKWGVDTQLFHPLNTPKQKAFVFVGAQKKRKGVQYVIDAMEKLINDFPEVRLYLLGEINHKYRQIVIEKNMDQNIIFQGHVSHEALLSHFSICQCHVLPSVNTKTAFEGYGLVHLEANACGIPSIGSKKTANESVIEPGINGFLVEPENVDELYLTMKEVIGNPSKTLKLCASALNYARQNTWRKNLLKFIDVVEQLGATR